MHLATSFVKIVQSPSLKHEKETEESSKVGQEQNGLEEEDTDWTVESPHYFFVTHGLWLAALLLNTNQYEILNIRVPELRQLVKGWNTSLFATAAFCYTIHTNAKPLC